MNAHPAVSKEIPAMHVLYLSVLQGVTELFPFSSLGHILLVPALFGTAVDAQAPQLLPFLVTLHLGTAVALGLPCPLVAACRGHCPAPAGATQL